MPEPIISLFALSPGDLCLGGSLIPIVYAELPELHENGTLEEVMSRIMTSNEQLERSEILIVLDGQLIGFACIAEDADLHVGRCLSLQWQYVVPEHRGRIGAIFLRILIRLGKRLGHQAVAYSHRISRDHYAIRYRSLTHE